MTNEIIIYQPENQSAKLEVVVESETIWLSQSQIVELFDNSKANISEHIKHIFSSKELTENSTVRNFRTVRKEGNRNVSREIMHFNLDATIYTKPNKQLALDVKKHKLQYPEIKTKILTKSHDRFIILDKKGVYHFGASLKDLGKKWFAFSKMEMDAEIILKQLD